VEYSCRISQLLFVVVITSRGWFPQRIHRAQLVGLMGLVVVHMRRMGVDIERMLLFPGRVVEAVEGASDGLGAAAEDVGKWVTGGLSPNFSSSRRSAGLDADDRRAPCLDRGIRRLASPPCNALIASRDVSTRHLAGFTTDQRFADRQARFVLAKQIVEDRCPDRDLGYAEGVGVVADFQQTPRQGCA